MPDPRPNATLQVASSATAPKLTTHMRLTLQTALATDELRRPTDTRTPHQRPRTIHGQPNPQHIPPPAWPAPPVTLTALVRRGYLEAGERRNRRGRLLTVWRITTTGRQALTDHDQTRTRQGGQQRVSTGKTLVDYEMQVVTQRDGTRRLQRVPVERPDRLSSRHGLEAQARWDEAQDRHAQARRFAARLKAA